MNFRKRYPLMNEAGPDGAPGGGEGAPNPGSTPPGDGAPNSGANDSLLKAPSADDFSWLDQKFQVKDAEGKLDLSASSKKLNESYAALSKRLGTGDVPPATPTEYQFQPPEQFKDMKLDDQLSNTFRERAHKLGLTQQQYQGVVESHLELVPGVLDSVLKLSAAEAKADLQKVWTTPEQFDSGIKDAQRAIDALPTDLGQDIWARLGRDPGALRAFAHLGSQMREDKSVSQQTTSNAGAASPEVLMAGEAYRNPRHPEHAAVSAKVKAMFEAQHGAGTPFQ